MKGRVGLKCWLLIFLFAAAVSGCSKKESYGKEQQPFRGKIVRDVTYANNTNWRGQSEALLMDIYIPPMAEQEKALPVVVHMHGGGYVTGDKSGSIGKCVALADSGFIVASINYRMGWNTGSGVCGGDLNSFYDAMYRAIQDANAAIRYLVSKPEKYYIDTTWIFLSGSSAGADIALSSSYIDNAYAQTHYPASAEKLGSLHTAGNPLTNTYAIKGISSVAGSLFDSTLLNSERSIPTIFFHGERDEVVPADYGYYNGCTNYPLLCGSLCLYRQLVAHGKPAVVHLLPGGGHGINGEGGFDTGFMMSNTACFFHSLMNKETHSGIYIGKENSCR